MQDQQYYNLVASILALGVVLVLFLAAVVGASAQSGSSSAPSAPSTPANMYLTIQINPDNGMPQYSPSNFSVPAGLVTFTITDFDTPVNWSACVCNVAGTVGGTEAVNGTAYSVVPTENAAHTFSVPSLGLNVVSPGGGAVVTFTVDLTQKGTFAWLCEAPCGSDGYSGTPMGTGGYMSGSMTVS